MFNLYSNLKELLKRWDVFLFGGDSVNGISRITKKEIVIYAGFYILIAILHIPYWRQPHYWDSLGAYYPATDWILKHGISPFIGGHANMGHPPLVFWITAVCVKIFGNLILVSHLVHYFFAALLSFSAYLFGKRLVNRGFGILAGILLMFVPMIYAQTSQYQLDLPLSAFILAAAYCLWREKWKTFFLASSAMILTKAYGWVFLFFFIAFHLMRCLIFERRKIRISPYLVLPILVYPVYIGLLYLFTNTWIAGEHWKKNFEPRISSCFFYFWETQKILFGSSLLYSGLGFLFCFFLLFLLFSSFRVIKSIKTNRIRLRELTAQSHFIGIALVLFLALFAYLFWTPMEFPCVRYPFPSYAPFCLLGLYGAWRLFGRYKKIFIPFVAMIVVIFIIKWHWILADRIARFFPPSFSDRVYKLLVFEDCRDGKRPISYSGEFSLTYSDIVALSQQMGRYLEEFHRDDKVIATFPVVGYLFFPDQEVVREKLKLKFPQNDVFDEQFFSDGDIIVNCSIQLWIDIHKEACKYTNPVLIKKFERNGQWIALYKYVKGEDSPNDS